MDFVKKWFEYGKGRLKENSFDSLVWTVNIIPTLLGFSIRKDTIKAPFFIIHICLLIYVYGVGSLVFQIKYAQNAADFIKNYVTVSLLVLIANNTYWFIVKRPLLRKILKQSEVNDDKAKSPELKQKHEKYLFGIKRIVILVYSCNYTNMSLVYLRERIDLVNQYSLTPCVGITPLTESPNQEICKVILSINEFFITFVVLNYQCLLLFLIAHTTVMYQMLAEEIKTLNTCNIENHLLRQKLHEILERHVLTLDTVQKLKDLYSMPIGVNFGCNAVCICFFFFLPLDEYIKFSPILIYCFLVFFLYCFLCQRLINAAEEFATEVYSCGWEKFPIQEQKLIYIMTMLAQKPIVFLAADIVPVNIYTFATTMQAMYKFVTVVKL